MRSWLEALQTQACVNGFHTYSKATLQCSHIMTLIQANILAHSVKMHKMHSHEEKLTHCLTKIRPHCLQLILESLYYEKCLYCA